LTKLNPLTVLVIVVIVAVGAYMVGRSHSDSGMTPYQPVPAPNQPQPGRGIPPFPAGQRSGTSTLPPGFTFGREQKLVDLNTATLAELETLPGITPESAKKILAGRPYEAMKDLERVGIPHDVVEQISPPAIIRVMGRGSPPVSAPPPKTKKP
jgi:hypothetical protein